MKIVKGYKKTALGKEKKQYLKIGENCIKIFFSQKQLNIIFKNIFKELVVLKQSKQSKAKRN